MGFVDKFLVNNPEDKFFNLKRKEDISTIYHDEYKEHHEDLDYWCDVPVGFPVDCDKILGIFGPGGAIAVACTQLNGTWTFKLIKKNRQGLPDLLVQLGYEFDKEYPEEDLASIECMIK